MEWLNNQTVQKHSNFFLDLIVLNPPEQWQDVWQVCGKHTPDACGGKISRRNKQSFLWQEESVTESTERLTETPGAGIPQQISLSPLWCRGISILTIGWSAHYGLLSLQSFIQPHHLFIATYALHYTAALCYPNAEIYNVIKQNAFSAIACCTTQ